MSNPRLTAQEKASWVRRSSDWFRDRLTPIGRFLLRDTLSTFLLVASIVLLIIFFSLVGSLGAEGSGRKVPISTVERLASAQRIRAAELLDYDHQAVVTTDTGIQLYADYPEDGSAM